MCPRSAHVDELNLDNVCSGNSSDRKISLGYDEIVRDVTRRAARQSSVQSSPHHGSARHDLNFCTQCRIGIHPVLCWLRAEADNELAIRHESLWAIRSPNE